MTDDQKRVLEYLKKEGPTNTFRLSRELGVDRSKLLQVLQRLQQKEAIEFRSGTATFVKFPREELKVAIAVKPAPSKKTFPSKKKKIAIRGIQKSDLLKELQAENLNLKEKMQALEKTMKAMEQKVAFSPKIITRTITKKIPFPSLPPLKKKIKRKKNRITKKREVKREKTARKKKAKFKFPTFNLMKDITRLEKPEFIKKGG